MSLHFAIARDVRITARTKDKARKDELVTPTGAFGDLAQAIKTQVVQMDAKETPWLPIYDDDKQPTGLWKQDVELTWSFEAKCPPSMDTRLLTVEVRNLSFALIFWADLPAQHYAHLTVMAFNANEPVKRKIPMKFVPYVC